jgi:hypothetical protein
LCVHASVAPVCVLVDSHCYGRAFGAAKWPPSTDGHCAGGAPFASPITTWPPRPTPTATGARVRAAIGIKDKHLHIITRIFSGAVKADDDGAACFGATSATGGPRCCRLLMCLLVSVDAAPLRSVGGMEGCVLQSYIFCTQNECPPPSLPPTLPALYGSNSVSSCHGRRVLRRA